MQIEGNHLFQIMRWQWHLNWHCRQVHGVLVGYQGKILLVGNNYDSEKHHACVIEEL